MTDAEIGIIERTLNERRDKFRLTKKYSDEVYYNGQKNLAMDLGLRLIETENHKIKLERK